MIEQCTVQCSHNGDEYIGDECLKYVDTFKYLGFVFSENKKDDADMLRQLRSLYAKANRITRMFTIVL